MSNDPDVMSKVDCGVNVEFEISSTPPRSMLTAREVVMAAGKDDNNNVFVEPFGADTTKLLSAKLATGVAESAVTVFVPALLMTVKSKLVDGSTPADQFVVALQSELAALIQRLVTAAERDSDVNSNSKTNSASLDKRSKWDL